MGRHLQPQSGAVRNAVGAVLLVVFVPFCLWQFSGPEMKSLGVLSPLVALFCAGDFPYRSASGWYWASLVGGNVLALPRRWSQPACGCGG